MVTPAARRQGVEHLVTANLASQRRACRLVDLSRSVMQYRPRPKHDKVLCQRLKELATQYPRYGYLMLHGLLAAEGLVINRKRTYRLYCEANLQVRTRRRKKLIRPRIPMMIPDGRGQRWSLDFVSDQLASSRRFRVLNIVDDYSRECIGQIVDTSISGLRLAGFLEEIGTLRSLPKTIVCDNGSELTSKAMFFWSQRSGVKLHFIQPGKPTQNAFVESFNARTCLNQHWFRNLQDARRIINDWRRHYNYVRPHSSLGYVPPAVFAQQAA